MKREDRKIYNLIYSYDSTVSSIPERKIPLQVIFPECEEDIVEIVKDSNKKGIPLYIRGSGSSVVGNSVPVEKGIIVSLEKMDKIKSLSRVGRLITVEAGITVEKANRYLKKYNLFIPGYPASYKFSSVGGNLASNSSGLLGIRYGILADYVKKLRIVTGSGELLEIGYNAQRSSIGDVLKGLFLGSFGKYGIIYEATLGLLPIEKKVYEYTYQFDTPDTVLRFINEIYGKGILPIKMEIIGNTISDLILNRNEYYIIIMTDKRLKGVKKAEIVNIRTQLSPILSSIRKHKFSIDLSIDLQYFNEFNELIEKKKDENIFIGYYGHIGDGLFHLNICFDKETDKVREVKNSIFDFVEKVNGVISGEHGYGYTKRIWAKKQLSVNIKYLRRIKEIFDPNNILNRGLDL